MFRDFLLPIWFMLNTEDWFSQEWCDARVWGVLLHPKCVLLLGAGKCRFLEGHTLRSSCCPCEICASTFIFFWDFFLDPVPVCNLHVCMAACSGLRFPAQPTCQSRQVWKGAVLSRDVWTCGRLLAGVGDETACPSQRGKEHFGPCCLWLEPFSSLNQRGAEAWSWTDALLSSFPLWAVKK